MEKDVTTLLKEVQSLLVPCITDMSDSVDAACEALSQVENQLYDIQDIILKERTEKLSPHELEELLTLTTVLARSFEYIDSVESFVLNAEKKVKALKSLQKAQQGGFKGRLINKNAAISQLQQLNLDADLSRVKIKVDEMKSQNT